MCDFPWSEKAFLIVFFLGSQIISRDELSAFYSSALGIDTLKVGEIIDVAYQAMTSVGSINSLKQDCAASNKNYKKYC